jgi:hypothetical protein
MQMLEPFSRTLSPDLTAAEADSYPEEDFLTPEMEREKSQQAADDLTRLAAAAEFEQRTRGMYPDTWEALVDACAACADHVVDPFDGQDYGYINNATYFLLFSSGPDADPRTTDDIVYDSRTGLTRGWTNAPTR